ncbi:hypothetical protein ABPG74_006372 [Tetrahymena malaccensis]
MGNNQQKKLQYETKYFNNPIDLLRSSQQVYTNICINIDKYKYKKSYFDDRGINELCSAIFNCKNLINLSLDLRIQDQGLNELISMICNCTNLQSLNLDLKYSSITNLNIAKCYNLINLKINTSWTEVSIMQLICLGSVILKNFSKLQTLEIKHKTLDQTIVEDLPNFQWNWDSENNILTKNDIPIYKKMKKLVKLKIDMRIYLE